MSQNFKAVAQLHTELYLLKVEKLNACIRPLLQIRSHLEVPLYVCSAQNMDWKLVCHLFKIGTLLQTIIGFPIGNVQ